MSPWEWANKLSQKKIDGNEPIGFIVRKFPLVGSKNKVLLYANRFGKNHEHHINLETPHWHSKPSFLIYPITKMYNSRCNLRGTLLLMDVLQLVMTNITVCLMLYVQTVKAAITTAKFHLYNAVTFLCKWIVQTPDLCQLLIFPFHSFPRHAAKSLTSALFHTWLCKSQARLC